MKNFITNSGAENLRNRLAELINKSEELKFLVGFFYFSGIRELYSELKKNPKVIVNVLVGLNVDEFNYQLIEYADTDNKNGHLSNEEISQNFFGSLKKSINTEKFDNKEFYEQVRFFVDMIKDDRLVIRKTFKPNHAKLYIFKLQSEQIGRKTLFITGSSNLTSFGLTTQEEFNVEISDYGFENAEKYFDILWSEAVKITENDSLKKRLIELIEKETLVKKITPFEAFVLVLKAYLDSFEKKEIDQSLIKRLEENGYIPYLYQLDAIRQALAIIENNNGVILADVVGLGKTIIACSVAKELGKKRGIIICPPGLMGDPRKKDSGWNMYKEQFGLYDWEVWSLGDLEKLQEFVKKAKDIEVVIIDEAHRFRNQDTKNYEYLKNICRNKQVILLTATPFNNRPGDILSLLKLFITPKKSSITLESNLVDRFKSFKGSFDRLGYIKKHWNSSNEQKRKKAHDYYETFFGEKFNTLASPEKVKQRSKYLAKQIRDVIEPVTIRRNRLDLERNPYYKKEVKNLSKVADPKEWFFELSKDQSEFYDRVIGTCFGDPDEGGKFRGAIYRPFEYEKARERIFEDKLTGKENFEFYSQRNLYDFMRRLLVKRFESSFGSFEQSLKNFKHITESVLKFIEKTESYILDRSLLERIYDKEPEEIEQHLKDYIEKINAGQYPKNHKIYKLSGLKYKDEFLADIHSDLALFNEVLKSLHELNLVKNDPKTFCLIQSIKSQFKKEPKRKIIIFSEYLDTVKYLEPRLKKIFGDRLLTIAGDLKPKIPAINKNFDASYEKQENKYDILLSSDKISEGFNLNRAGMVINYDIPWNPVRVIQRVGRINRISKKVFEALYIVNFFPTERGSELVQSREIASNKMFLIHNTLGEDAKIFDIDEEPRAADLYNRIQQNPDKLEEESFYTTILKEFEKIKQSHPDLISNLNSFPSRIKVAKKFIENELLVFFKKGRIYLYGAKYGEDNKHDIFQATLEEAFEKISCGPEEKSVELSEKFWNVYEDIKNFRDHRTGPANEQSLEQQAINNLKTFIYHKHEDEVIQLKDFLKTLLEDITDYGTLSDYTLRRIANLMSNTKEDLQKSLREIEDLKNELGIDYLEKEKVRQKNLTKEIIVAIENQKS